MPPKELQPVSAATEQPPEQVLREDAPPEKTPPEQVSPEHE